MRPPRGQKYRLRRLNRNILECKFKQIAERLEKATGLNRNILECKWYTLAVNKRFKKRLNRNILECKLQTRNNDDGRLRVLIETYWNVNIILSLHYLKQYEVLIETYWNVNNLSCKTRAVAARRLNRNILECKSNLNSF